MSLVASAHNCRAQRERGLTRGNSDFLSNFVELFSSHIVWHGRRGWGALGPEAWCGMGRRGVWHLLLLVNLRHIQQARPELPHLHGKKKRKVG